MSDRKKSIDTSDLSRIALFQEELLFQIYMTNNFSLNE